MTTLSNTIRVMSRETGRMISGRESLRQRLEDCLSFPKGLLVGDRGYGFDVYGLLDKNVTPSYSVEAFMEITKTINDPLSGVKDFKLENVGVAVVGENHIELTMSGLWEPLGEIITLEGVKIGGS